MSELDRPGGELPLTEADFEAYRQIAEGYPPPAGYNPDRLIALRLVDPDPYTPGAFIPHDPRAAAQGLTTAVLRDLTRLTEQVAHIPALERLAEHFDPHRLYGGPGSEFLSTAALMNARLGEVGAAALKEFLSVQPGEPADRDPAILRLGVERTRSALRRGVHVRSIYHRSAHEHDQTREYVSAMVADGADVRASDMPGPRMVIIDGRHLFIDNLVIDGAEGNSGWHVFDRAAVAWVRGLFDLFWDAAERWQDLCATREASPLSERQLRILRMLAAGYAQQQIGSRIGLSERAIAKELRLVRHALGAQTTYEVMAWYGRQQVTRETPST
ncbi:LuxR C-terminal-related transcriptional regulator [Streptomyces sp. NPDC059717]|uniref:LuxR C-terminal-related transcriptional regulator n=1 Tax=Streptomyces sp. NPDC059717 TaxID=3346922 RepID=UPI00367CA777